MIRALGNHIVVKQDKAPAKQGKILLPESAQKSPCCGLVMSVGPDVEDVKKGHKVWYGEYAGHEIEDVLVITEEDVLGVGEEA
jgi:co-chaperonin GroES (HSP10)